MLTLFRQQPRGARGPAKNWSGSGRCCRRRPPTAVARGSSLDLNALLDAFLAEAHAGAARSAETTADAQPDTPAVDSLTARELEIIGLIAQGLSNRQIARDADLLGRHGQVVRQPDLRQAARDQPHRAGGAGAWAGPAGVVGAT
ncbi:MAG: hypothetical protein IPK19_19495 [Chloroflexi bacterium]|nr:hypothetical protein [Chloroflexota bacterium]